MKKKYVLVPLILAAVALSACGGQSVVPISELKTPQYEIPAAPTVDFNSVPPEEIHSAGGGVVKIIPKSAHTAPEAGDTAPNKQEEIDSESSALTGEVPETIWENDQTVTYNAFTLPDKAAINNEGVVGILTIPAINLSMNVYEAANEMEASATRITV